MCNLFFVGFLPVMDKLLHGTSSLDLMLHLQLFACTVRQHDRKSNWYGDIFIVVYYCLPVAKYLTFKVIGAGSSLISHV